MKGGGGGGVKKKKKKKYALISDSFFPDFLLQSSPVQRQSVPTSWVLLDSHNQVCVCVLCGCVCMCVCVCVSVLCVKHY